MMRNIWSWGWLAFALWLGIIGFSMSNIEKGNSVIYLAFVIAFFAANNVD